MKKCVVVIALSCMGTLATSAMERDWGTEKEGDPNKPLNLSSKIVETEIVDSDFLAALTALEERHLSPKVQPNNIFERNAVPERRKAQEDYLLIDSSSLPLDLEEVPEFQEPSKPKRLTRKIERAQRKLVFSGHERSISPQPVKKKKKNSPKEYSLQDHGAVLQIRDDHDGVKNLRPSKHQRLRGKREAPDKELQEEALQEEALDDDADLFSDEGDGPKLPKKAKATRQKKARAKYSGKTFLGLAEEDEHSKQVLTSAFLAARDDSDDEDEADLVPQHTLEELPASLATVIETGTQLKLLANVYLGKIDEMANIFFPQYVANIVNEDGSLETVVDYFRTPKGEICVFASGGIQNAWEKTVARVHEVFFGQKVKIIRQRWIQKHLRKDKRLIMDIARIYKGREQELHSEFYYDLYFEHFFLPGIKELGEEKGIQFKKLTINSFSWWEICNGCNETLTKHKDLCEKAGIELVQHTVAATRRYRHHYPEGSPISACRVPKEQEEAAWQAIWSEVQKYANGEFEDEEAKKHFWTKTVEGLELCKWLGQAFVENTHSLKGRSEKPRKKGDILKFYCEVTEEDAQPLKELLLYLREKNWDLSCWYKIPYPNGIQRNWKKYWLQVVMPHFNWKIVAEFDDDSRDNVCQMCGNEDVFHMHWVYHPKFRVSQEFLDLPEAQQELTERDLGYNYETPIDQLPLHLQRERRQSLTVGSECVKFLGIKRAEVNDWRDDHPDEELEARLQGLDDRQAQNDMVDESEAQDLLNWMEEELEGQASPLRRRYITANSNWGSAKELNPLLEILLRKRQIQEVEKGSFILKGKVIK
jgi:hypothetical protein